MLVENEENLCRVHYTEDEMWSVETYAFEIDTSTLCQCTGLKDLTGNLIWENDIVLTPREDGYSVIRWCITEAKWVISNEIEMLIIDFDNYWSNEIEVCGNIFDNTELLEMDKSVKPRKS